MKTLKRLFLRFARDERGDGGLESAVVTPIFLMLAMMVLAIAFAAWQMIMAAAATPLVARQASVEQGNVAAAQAALPGVAAAVRRAPAGCLRAVESTLGTAQAVWIPLVPEFRVRLRGGSLTRLWQFWAGPPVDGCN